MKEYFTLHDFPFTVLFEPWVINTALTLAFTCISFGAVAFFFEGIRVFRVLMKRYFHVAPLYPMLSRRLTDSSSDTDVAIPANQAYIKSNRLRNHIFQTILHGVRVTLGYFLMLAFMTYNAYIGIGIILGATIGYFLFCHELTRWHEPDVCPSTMASSTTSTSANSSPPGEEAHPMLLTASNAPTCTNLNDEKA